MTKEELEKEAEEKAFSYAQLIPCSPYMEKRHREIDFKEGYLAGAEPREKRIAELEKRCANYEMTISKMEKGTCDICKETEKDKKIEGLEAQIEKMKCCHNCKNCAYAGFEIICRTYDCINQSKWEIKEK